MWLVHTQGGNTVLRAGMAKYSPHLRALPDLALLLQGVNLPVSARSSCSVHEEPCTPPTKSRLSVAALATAAKAVQAASLSGHTSMHLTALLTESSISAN